MRVSPQTLTFYRKVRFRTAWLTNGEPDDQAAAILGTIARAGDDGLKPEHYGYDRARRIMAALEPEDDDVELDDTARADYLGDLDIVLSEGFMRYAADIVAGTIAQDDVADQWRIPRTDVVGEHVLRSVVRGGDPQQIIQRLRPSTPHYARLMAALKRLNDIRDAAGWTVLPEELGLTEGDSSAAVVALRQRLARSDDPREAALARRGEVTAAVFDRDLRDALRNFQRRHAIDDDGVLGTATLRELNHTVDERIGEIALNLDRWRWLPRELGDFFIIVNIAGFELEVIENDRAIEAMNVVVGKPGWSTPVFSDTVKHVVVNPYWTPPKSIIEEEILPAIERDPTYLERNDFERTNDGGFRPRTPSSRNRPTSRRRSRSRPGCPR
jgi:murein L,D-transpeptidase YcbB/YkuD